MVQLHIDLATIVQYPTCYMYVLELAVRFETLVDSIYLNFEQSQCSLRRTVLLLLSVA